MAYQILIIVHTRGPLFLELLKGFCRSLNTYSGSDLAYCNIGTQGTTKAACTSVHLSWSWSYFLRDTLSQFFPSRLTSISISASLSIYVCSYLHLYLYLYLYLCLYQLYLHVSSSISIFVPTSASTFISNFISVFHRSLGESPSMI